MMFYLYFPEQKNRSEKGYKTDTIGALLAKPIKWERWNDLTYSILIPDA